MEFSERIFQEFIDGDGDRVQESVDKQEPESLFLEFKESRSTDGAMTPDDRKNLGKNLSAFANASGGVIVWGVQAKQINSKNPERNAFDLKPIPRIRRFVDDLNSQVGQLVQRQVPDVQNHMIGLEDGSGYAVTLIPESDLRPHMSLAADDKRYYIRSGSQSLVIDHIMVESLMLAKIRPKLELVVDQTGATLFTQGATDTGGIRAHLAIRNTGAVPARNVAVSLMARGQRRYIGKLELARSTIVHVTCQDGIDRHALLFSCDPGVLVYPGTRVHGIEIEEPWSHEMWYQIIHYRIYADDFSLSGKLSIDPGLVVISRL